MVKQVKTKIFFNYKTKHYLPFLIAKALKKGKEKNCVSLKIRVEHKRVCHDSSCVRLL